VAEHSPRDACRFGGHPDDARLPGGTLVGRVWSPACGGPSPVTVRDGVVVDVSSRFATVRDLCEQADPAAALAEAIGTPLGDYGAILANTDPARRDERRPWLLAPVDLQTLKAAGVTFAASLLERVIEERAGGRAEDATAVRRAVTEELGADLAAVRPGTPEAARVERYLREQGMWSQYLEVGIGPDAEIFTKAPTLAAVGTWHPVGVARASTWNNPEPEVALVVASSGAVVGATLANDVNLRDVEGRSALLLPMAKDNNASCALGPLVRLFDPGFGIDHVRAMRVRLTVDGRDGFVLDEVSDMTLISRDPLDLVGQLIGPRHQYPDGAVLMLGTMFAPVKDRDVPGSGFTHQDEDIVRITAGELGSLVNVVRRSEDCPPWTFGLRDLMGNLASRGLLETAPASAGDR
jgi:fumarylacetoacetate (FAA) hydrolase family protein